MVEIMIFGHVLSFISFNGLIDSFKNHRNIEIQLCQKLNQINQNEEQTSSIIVKLSSILTTLISLLPYKNGHKVNKESP
jgi:aspartate ammonia-lyase